VAQSFYRKTEAHDFRISLRSLSVCAASPAPTSRSSDDAWRFVERLSPKWGDGRRALIFLCAGVPSVILDPSFR
jgi:hypothetical protein